MKTLIQNVALIAAPPVFDKDVDVMMEGTKIVAIEKARSVDPSSVEIVYSAASLSLAPALTDYSANLVDKEAGSLAEVGVTRLIEPAGSDDCKVVDVSRLLASDFDMIDGALCRRLGLRGQPGDHELGQVMRTVDSSKTGQKTVILGLGDARSVKAIAQARQAGAKLQCGVPIANLHLNSTDLSAFDPAYKLNPPLRDEANRQVLIEQVKSGAVDFIYSNHQPHIEENKDRAFEACAFNGPTRQSLLPALVTVSKQESIPLHRCFPTLEISSSPLCVGAAANLVLFDSEKPLILRSSSPNKVRTSPFHGRLLSGQLIQVWNNGTAVLPV